MVRESCEIDENRPSVFDSIRYFYHWFLRWWFSLFLKIPTINNPEPAKPIKEPHTSVHFPTSDGSI